MMVLTKTYYSLFALVLVIVATKKGVASQHFQPTRISYQALVAGDAAILESSLEAFAGQGLMAVTDIPGLQEKSKLLTALAQCVETTDDTVQSYTFADGTRRRTLATHTTPQGTPEPLWKKKNNNNKSFASLETCQALEEASTPFRRAVADTTQLLAKRFSDYLGFEDNGSTPLLRTAQRTNGYISFADVVQQGEHLEHFHSYQKLSNNKEETIEMHTDQGLMIAFTPGQWVSVNEDATDQANLGLSSGFFIQLPDDSVTEVAFQPTDDLVFVLGDGVNQFVNDKLQAKGRDLIRAVPHMLRLDFHRDTLARTWYGRMVLPPPDALADEDTGTTFGDLRAALIGASLEGLEHEQARGVGCSGHQVPRDLSATTCEEDELYCWHRCIPLAEEGLTPQSCADQGLDLVCTNPRGLVSDGLSHGDYFPGCLDASTALPDTPYPTLPDYPRDEDLCKRQDYDTLVEGIAQEYVHKVSLNENSTLVWTVENGVVKGKLAFNGLFGWLSIGLAGPEGSGKNGMHNARVIMAHPGGDYSAVDGFDLDMEPEVHEYEIHPTKSAFRH